MFDSLANSVSGSAWTYLLIVAICAGDALLPLLPSETVVLTAAVLASRGRLNIGLVAAQRGGRARCWATTPPTGWGAAVCAG